MCRRDSPSRCHDSLLSHYETEGQIPPSEVMARSETPSWHQAVLPGSGTDSIISITAAPETAPLQQERLYHGGRLYLGMEV